MHKGFSCRKFIVLIVLAVSGAAVSFAQNGLPLDFLQQDPYFESSNIEAEKERRAQAIKDGSLLEDETEGEGVQYTNPDDPATFYNAENWVYGEYDYTSAPPEQTTPGANPEAPAGEPAKDSARKKKTQQQKDAEDEVEFAEGNKGAPMVTDAIRAGKTSELPFSDVKFTFGAGWCPFMVLPVSPGSIDFYFNQTKLPYFVPAAASVHFDWAARRIGNCTLGVGFNSTWNYLVKNTEYYKLSTHQFTFSGLFVVRIGIADFNVLNLHFGGGGILFHDVMFAYANGYKTPPLDWIFPEATAGLDFTVFLAKHWGLGAGADFMWPFLLGENGAQYPLVQFKVNTSVRF